MVPGAGQGKDVKNNLIIFQCVISLLSCMFCIACDQAIPESCVTACARATAFHASCLAEAGSSFADYGYDDSADYEDACLTWAWEEKQLEDAGVLDQSVEDLCKGLAEAYPQAACPEEMSVDWRSPP